MGVILDSSVIIAAERRGETVDGLLQTIIDAVGDQECALSAVGLTELVHGIYRAHTDLIRQRRLGFVNDLLAALSVYPFTSESAQLAGKIDAEQQERGVVVPFADLLIGATALSVGYSILTGNPRHFRQIPGLSVIQI